MVDKSTKITPLPSQGCNNYAIIQGFVISKRKNNNQRNCFLKQWYLKDQPYPNNLQRCEIRILSDRVFRYVHGRTVFGKANRIGRIFCILFTKLKFFATRFNYFCNLIVLKELKRIFGKNILGKNNRLYSLFDEQPIPSIKTPSVSKDSRFCFGWFF